MKRASSGNTLSAGASVPVELGRPSFLLVWKLPNPCTVGNFMEALSLTQFLALLSFLEDEGYGKKVPTF